MTNTTKPTATDRRYLAIGTVSEQALNLPITEAVALIATLAPLGRTDRWKAAVARWQEMVSDETNDRRWAILQGGIFCGHAAD